MEAAVLCGAQQIRDLIEGVIHFGKIPAEWEESIIVSLYKGKDFALERGNYGGLRLLDQDLFSVSCLE